MTRTRIICLSLLLFFKGSAGAQETRKISLEVYKDKVYASWLAQCIGNMYGLPHENEYIDAPGPEKFPYGYYEPKRMKAANGAFSDDDTDLEYMYLQVMEEHGPEPTYDLLAEYWKYHIQDRLWLANRGALTAMHYGLTPPVTGWKDLNPHWFQIDPQLINEIWAVTAPGMVRYAAQKSEWAARITDDSWGVEPTVHYGAMYAAAFFESDINKLIDIGTAALPKGSRFAATVEDMKALYAKYPHDWKGAWKVMAEKYYINEPLDAKTIWNANLNGAAGILSLLYGKGDFQKTLDMACALGFDADNQAATMSGLLGVVLGTKGIPRDLLFPFPELGWKEPLNDLYKNVSRYDMPDASLKDIAERMARQGEKIALMHGGKKITENGQTYLVINPNAEFVPPLELPVAPMPVIEVGSPVDFTFPLSGATGSATWSAVDGSWPQGLAFRNGRLSGTAVQSGISRVRLQVSESGRKAEREFVLVVREKNLAPQASGVIANVRKPDPQGWKAERFNVGQSLYADSVEVIRDGRRLGDGSTFYSIGPTPGPKTDYYGYEWTDPQTIGLIGYHVGSVEGQGGWFTSLNAEYRDAQGDWKPVEGLVISPPLPLGDAPFNKPHFLEYLLAFKPVETRAIRIIGKASNRSGPQKTAFTSISELSVHGPLPGHEVLKR